MTSSQKLDVKLYNIKQSLQPFGKLWVIIIHDELKQSN